MQTIQQQQQLIHHSQASSTHKPLQLTGLNRRSNSTRRLKIINSSNTTISNSSSSHKHLPNNSRSSSSRNNNNNNRIDRRQVTVSRCLVLEEDRSTVSTQTATVSCGIHDQKFPPVIRVLWNQSSTPMVGRHPAATHSRPV